MEVDDEMAFTAEHCKAVVKHDAIREKAREYRTMVPAL
jgi:hypothetical protein